MTGKWKANEPVVKAIVDGCKGFISWPRNRADDLLPDASSDAGAQCETSHSRSL